MGYGHHVGALLIFLKWRASPGGLRNHCYHVLSIRLCYKAEVVISCHPFVVLWLFIAPGAFQFKSRSNWLSLVQDFLHRQNIGTRKVWWWSLVDPGLDSQDGNCHENYFMNIHVLGGLFCLLPEFRLTETDTELSLYIGRHSSSDQSSKVEKNVR